MSFYLPRLIWILLNPLNLLLLLMCLSLLLQFTRWRITGRRVMVFCILCLVVPAILPIGRVMIAVLESRFSVPDPMPAQVDGIIVLGGMVDLQRSEDTGQPMLNRNAGRLTSFVELARRYPEARLVFTGGSGDLFPGAVREVDIAAQAMRHYGLDPARVTFEDRSRTTYENALFSRDLVSPQTGEVWLLVTSAFHMPRAVGTFRQAGWSVVPYPTAYLTPGIARSLTPHFDLVDGLRAVYAGGRAWVGLIAYRLLGRSEALWPAPAPPAPAA